MNFYTVVVVCSSEARRLPMDDPRNPEDDVFDLLIIVPELVSVSMSKVKSVKNVGSSDLFSSRFEPKYY